MNISKHARLSVLFTSITMPLTLFVSNTLEFFVKLINPQKVDITSDIAYLRPLLIVGIVTFIILLLFSMIFSALTFFRRERSFGKFMFLVNIVNTLLLIFALAFQSLLSGIKGV
jgi:hypothetical protein